MQYESFTSTTTAVTPPIPPDTPAFARSVGVARYGGVPTGIPTNDLFSLATAQLNRGFKYLTPLQPSTKRPAIKGYNKRAPTTLEDIRKWADKFPDYGCGVVCRRGIGTSLVFDCDSKGLIEQIESETGEEFPKTYVVASRLSVPYKRHQVFTQTEYSCKHLPRTINARNVHGRYDVKVNGQAVAAGTIHEKTGLAYTVVNEVPGFPIGIPIPDWLVDWLRMDRQRCKDEPWLYPKKKEPETVETETNETAVQMPLVSSERRFIQHGLGPKAEKVPQGYRYNQLCSLAGTMISRGIPRRGIEDALYAFAEDECEGLRTYAKEHKKEIHRIAYSNTLRFGGAWIGGKKDGHIVFELQAVTRHQLLLECARSFPNGLSAVERYERFTKALEGSGYTLDKQLAGGREEIRRGREGLGFLSDGHNRYARWYRNDPCNDPKGVCNINPVQGDIGYSHLRQEEAKKISVCLT